jgi:hypothetical protein
VVERVRKEFISIDLDYSIFLSQVNGVAVKGVVGEDGVSGAITGQRSYSTIVLGCVGVKV